MASITPEALAEGVLKVWQTGDVDPEDWDGGDVLCGDLNWRPLSKISNRFDGKRRNCILIYRASTLAVATPGDVEAVKTAMLAKKFSDGTHLIVKNGHCTAEMIADELAAAAIAAMPSLAALQAENERLRAALGNIAGGEAFREMRFAEDDDAEYHLRRERRAKLLAHAALQKAPTP